MFIGDEEKLHVISENVLQRIRSKLIILEHFETHILILRASYTRDFLIKVPFSIRCVKCYLQTVLTGINQ